MSANELRNHLIQLEIESAPTEEIEVLRDAYVGAAVTEIATLRAQLSGPQVG